MIEHRCAGTSDIVADSVGRGFDSHRRLTTGTAPTLASAGVWAFVVTRAGGAHRGATALTPLREGFAGADPYRCDLLREIGASRHRSADQVITAALESMRRDERRRLAADEARAVRDDPDDLAEIAAVQVHMAALREG